jgi:hypothetical protein
MKEFTVLRDVYNTFVKLKNNYNNNEEIGDLLTELGNEISKSEESIKNQIEFNKTEIERLSSL